MKKPANRVAIAASSQTRRRSEAVQCKSTLGHPLPARSRQRPQWAPETMTRSTSNTELPSVREIATGRQASLGQVRVKHSESRCLTPTAGVVPGSYGVLEISVQFIESRRRHRRSQSEVDRSSSHTATMRRKLTVRTRSALPNGGGPADGWTAAGRATAATSTISMQRSEVASEVGNVENRLSVVKELDGDMDGSEPQSQKQVPQHQARLDKGNSSAVDRRMRELELIGQRLGSAVAAKGACGLETSKLIQTRDYLLALRSFTDTALSIVSKYCPCPEKAQEDAPPPAPPRKPAPPPPPVPLRKSPPPAVPPRNRPPPPPPPHASPLEFFTFGSQLVMPSSTGAASTVATTLEARTSRPAPPALGKRINVVRCQTCPVWSTTEPAPNSQLCACLCLEPPLDFAACHVNPSARYIAVLHSGQHPTISQQALASAALAVRFATQEFCQRKLVNFDSPHLPEPPQLLTRPVEVARSFLPPQVLAVASQPPLFAPLLCACALRRALPAPADRRASHPLLLLRGRLCGTSCRKLLAAAFVSSVQIGPDNIAETSKDTDTGPMDSQDTWNCSISGSHQKTESKEWTDSAGIVRSRSAMSFAAAQYLRIAILPMPPEHGARRVRPHLLLGSAATGLVESPGWPPQTKSASSATASSISAFLADEIEFTTASDLAACLMKSKMIAAATVSIASGDQPDPQLPAAPSQSGGQVPALALKQRLQQTAGDSFLSTAGDVDCTQPALN